MCERFHLVDVSDDPPQPEPWLSDANARSGHSIGSLARASGVCNIAQLFEGVQVDDRIVEATLFGFKDRSGIEQQKARLSARAAVGVP